MTLDVVNQRNEKVGSVDLRDEVFGGRVKADLIWESVTRENASRRRGTHATKNRALVSGSGKKPWRQKGTGRARVGEVRNPLWRKGGTVFGPQPRSYDYSLPKKVELGALTATEVKTKVAAEMLRGLGADGKTLLLDVHPDDKLALAVRNLAGVRFVPSSRVSARDVVDASRLIATRAALERLQEALA